ncbi:5360_t:CDS:2 [Scutellospora calospora]|uniref:5360_t:CDS:1 n=1 Tax=Scutellospora calospora TaxID=85575 RepID=A0ACA9KHH1_9GLOM|nr:5360_t:CDS:2 [Scutellospora calospora]
MIQFFANELQIHILTHVVTETNFANSCILRTVCKKWNTLIPLIIHEVVMNRLNSGLKFELIDLNGDLFWQKLKRRPDWSKKFPPTKYIKNFTKSFTFKFDNIDDTNIFPLYRFKTKISFSMEMMPIIKLGGTICYIALPKVVINDIYKYDFGHRNNIVFTVNEEG